MKNLQDWFDDYNHCYPHSCCPEELLSPTCSKELLDKWLSVFIVETRSKNGQPYPPKTLYLTGILQRMRNLNPDYPNFLSKDGSSFISFRTTLDNLFKSRREKGVRATSTHTESISNEEEDLLWDSGVLNTDTPKGLLRAVFYYSSLFSAIVPERI